MKTVAILCLFVLFVLTLPNEGLAVLEAGEQAPDFTLKTTSDEEVTLSQYQGQVVILHFWKSN